MAEPPACDPISGGCVNIPPAVVVFLVFVVTCLGLWLLSLLPI